MYTLSFRNAQYQNRFGARGTSPHSFRNAQHQNQNKFGGGEKPQFGNRGTSSQSLMNTPLMEEKSAEQIELLKGKRKQLIVKVEEGALDNRIDMLLVQSAQPAQPAPTEGGSSSNVNSSNHFAKPWTDEEISNVFSRPKSSRSHGMW